MSRVCQSRSEQQTPAGRPLLRGGLVALLLLTAGTGCVSRRLMVQSNPPGALVLLEGKEVGYTPTAVDFTYYGTREITLIKDGYETLTVLQKVPTPWYQIPGVDFFSDNLLPYRIADRHSFSYSMNPLRPEDITPNSGVVDRRWPARYPS
ncbi:MAG TPA: PEGA domain-containing protein, partial [Planctomycetaceae bacterium]|nr:PEGA domain-containing protein [Planctomycetaceae bacterium]